MSKSLQIFRSFTLFYFIVSFGFSLSSELARCCDKLLPRFDEHINEAPEGMVWIPGGTFTMGGQMEEFMNDWPISAQSRYDERPLITIQLDGFWMSKTPITNAEFKAFVENNYEALNNKDGQQILTELSYDDNKRLTVSRENCLRLVNSYVRQNSLQKYEDKKRIQMDATLQGLFPELAEVKTGKKVTQEENCYFHTLMGGISRHLKEQ